MHNYPPHFEEVGENSLRSRNWSKRNRILNFTSFRFFLPKRRTVEQTSKSRHAKTHVILLRFVGQAGDRHGENTDSKDQAHDHDDGPHKLETHIRLMPRS